MRKDYQRSPITTPARQARAFYYPPSTCAKMALKVNTGAPPLSSLANWSYVEGPVTIWPPGGFDDFGQPIDAPPYLITNIDYEFGGDVRRESNGNEFVPRITIYFEAAFDSALVPEREWYLKLGDHTDVGSAPSDAQRIRTVEAFPATKFGAGEIPDWIVTT